MFVFRGSDPPPEEMQSPERMQQSLAKWKEWIDSIAAKGKYVAGQPLQRDGKVVAGKQKKITDGPFAEGKEIIGGYFLIKAENLEDAVDMSKGCPSFEYGGSVEVREIMEMNM